MALTELMELRKNMLIEYGAHGAYRAYRAEKEYAYRVEKEYTYRV